jgi:putative two-component system response regulator
MSSPRNAAEAFDFGSQSLIAHLETMMARAYSGTSYCLIEHGKAVGELAAQLAEALGYPFTSLNGIDPFRLAGRFHDIGKVLVEERVRLASARYTASDALKMQAHAELGAQFLEDLGVTPFIVDAARYHHVRFAGGGYPRCFLAGPSIPFVARVVAVADYFTARTEKRLDREAEVPAAVWKDLLELRGDWFDPDIVDALARTGTFAAAIGRNPERFVLDLPGELKRTA